MTKRIFVCSPYAAPSPAGIAVNLDRARRLCSEVIWAGHAPYAPHLYLPTFLDDETPGDRERGIVAGLKFLQVCDEVWCWSTVSPGMAREIRHAVEYATAEAADPIRVLFPWGVAPISGECPVCVGWTEAWEASLYRKVCPLCEAVRLASAQVAP